jgi:predicted enzyme related to lactoylglutathione lyase
VRLSVSFALERPEARNGNLRELTSQGKKNRKAGSMNDELKPKSPSLANGKICYVEIPAIDVRVSAEFYSNVFGWKIRRRGDGGVAFDDTTGQVSGTWVVDCPPAIEPGLLIYIMVGSVAATIELVIAQGGEIVQPIGGDAPEITARFRDPAGNVLGLYQEPA